MLYEPPNEKSEIRLPIKIETMAVRFPTRPKQGPLAPPPKTISTPKAQWATLAFVHTHTHTATTTTHLPSNPLTTTPPPQNSQQQHTRCPPRPSENSTAKISCHARSRNSPRAGSSSRTSACTSLHSPMPTRPSNLCWPSIPGCKPTSSSPSQISSLREEANRASLSSTQHSKKLNNGSRNT